MEEPAPPPTSSNSGNAYGVFLWVIVDRIGMRDLEDVWPEWIRFALSQRYGNKNAAYQPVFTKGGGLEYMDNCIKTGECKKP